MLCMQRLRKEVGFSWDGHALLLYSLPYFPYPTPFSWACMYSLLFLPFSFLSISFLFPEEKEREERKAMHAIKLLLLVVLTTPCIDSIIEEADKDNIYDNNNDKAKLCPSQR